MILEDNGTLRHTGATDKSLARSEPYNLEQSTYRLAIQKKRFWLQITLKNILS